MKIAKTPTPPYYAVIFTSIRTEIEEGYSEMAEKMEELAQQQDGYLGIEFAAGDVRITVSYWRDLESIKNWKANVDHLGAQKLGREIWYSNYKTRIALVERDYGYEK